MRAVPITGCRVCAGSALTSVLDLGMMSPCGIFPRTPDENPAPEPLEVVRCGDCGLVQLAHDLPPEDTFNDGFGYRSATNLSMRLHLEDLAKRLYAAADLQSGDLVIDIGSNDGTFLSRLPNHVRKLGVDPVAGKFEEFYPANAALHDGFWDDRIASAHAGQAKAITCFACLYDLPDPNAFMAGVKKALRPDGVFMVEVADVYGATESWDVISHEHLMYFGAGSLNYLMERHGLDCFRMDRTTTNGGSLLVVARNSDHVAMAPASAFTFGDGLAERVEATVADCTAFFDQARRERAVVHGYAASTRGGTLLQTLVARGALYPKIDMRCIADASPDKWGKLTPGTLIRITSEKESQEARPDYLFVLASHFRDGFIEREREFLRRGGKMVFPFPQFEIVGEEVL